MLEAIRIVLYFVEIIFGVLVAALATGPGDEPTSTKTYQLLSLVERQSRNARSVARAWGTIFVLLLLIVAIWYFLKFCTSVSLPPVVESIAFGAFSVWWLIGAVVITAQKSGTASVVVAWLLIPMCVTSTIVAITDMRGTRKLDDALPSSATA